MESQPLFWTVSNTTDDMVNMDIKAHDCTIVTMKEILEEIPYVIQKTLWSLFCELSDL